jgi:hypothetical protein
MIALHRRAYGEVRLNKGKTGLFIDVTTVSPAPGRLSHRTPTFRGPGNHPSPGYRTEEPWKGKTAVFLLGFVLWLPKLGSLFCSFSITPGKTRGQKRQSVVILTC